MPRSLSFRHVETIYSVMVAGSVTGAACRLHITQPAVSNLIKDAEERLEFALFERQAGRLVPTARANVIFSEIERSFTGLETINDLCARLQHDERRTISIASGPAFAAAILPRVIRAYRQEGGKGAQELHFSVMSRTAESVQSMIASHKADLGFAVSNPPLPGVDQECICTPQLWCVLPSGHRLANRESVTPHDLYTAPMISLSGLEGFDQLAASAFLPVAPMPVSVIECPAAITACAMVEAGLGFALMNAIDVSLFRNAALCTVPFLPVLHTKFWAYSSSCRDVDGVKARLIELAKQVCTQTVIEVEGRKGAFLSAAGARSGYVQRV